MLNGKDIRKRGDKTLQECKKYLALWNSFLGPDGNFPSGKNHMDALTFVREKLVDIEESDDDEGEDEAEEGAGDSLAFPSNLIAFMICGPYFKCEFDIEPIQLLQINADSVAVSRATQRETAAVEKHIERDNQENRGVPSAIEQRMAIQRDQVVVAGLEIYNSAIKDSFEMEKYLAEISVGEVKESHHNNIRELALRKRKQVSDLEEENRVRVQAAATITSAQSRPPLPPISFIPTRLTRNFWIITRVISFPFVQVSNFRFIE